MYLNKWSRYSTQKPWFNDALLIIPYNVFCKMDRSNHIWTYVHFIIKRFLNYKHKERRKGRTHSSEWTDMIVIFWVLLQFWHFTAIFVMKMKLYCLHNCGSLIHVFDPLPYNFEATADFVSKWQHRFWANVKFWIIWKWWSGDEDLCEKFSNSLHTTLQMLAIGTLGWVLNQVSMRFSVNGPTFNLFIFLLM